MKVIIALWLFVFAHNFLYGAPINYIQPSISDVVSHFEVFVDEGEQKLEAARIPMQEFRKSGAVAVNLASNDMRSKNVWKKFVFVNSENKVIPLILSQLTSRSRGIV